MFADIDIAYVLKIVGAVVAVLFYFLAPRKKELPPEEWRPLPMDPETARGETSAQAPVENDWRKELNRLLREGRNAPPVPPPLPSEEYSPAPPPLPRSRSRGRIREVSEESPSPEHAPSPELAPTLEHYERSSEQVLPAAAAAYRYASSLESRTTAHLRGVTQHHSAPATVAHAERSPGVGHALQSLRHREGLRAALTAAIILGPPKAAEPRIQAG